MLQQKMTKELKTDCQISFFHQKKTSKQNKNLRNMCKGQVPVSEMHFGVALKMRLESMMSN